MTGEVLLDGLSLESTKAYLSRRPADHTTVRTDPFAFGHCTHFILMGHEVYPDLDSSTDEDEIERRSRMQESPSDSRICTAITSSRWK